MKSRFFQRRWSELLAAVFVFLCVRQIAAQEGGGARSIRVVVLEAETTSKSSQPSESRWSSLLEGLAACRFERKAPTSFPTELLGDADVVVLASESLPSSESLRALAAAVSGGLGLVVCAPAVRAGLSDDTLAELLGAREAELERETGIEDAAAGAQADSEELIVAVADQRHALTQCLTHFKHRVRVPRLVLGEGIRPLAVAVRSQDASRSRTSDGVPLVWSRRHGLGGVAATLLEVSGGPSRGAAATVFRRAVEWCARRPVSARLDGPLVLAPKAVEEDGFFLGRQIAAVMSYRGAEWLTRVSREEEERPEEVLDALGLEPGQTVADLGAGNGFFTLKMARRVGPDGRVLAVDIQKEMLALLAERAREAGLSNVENVLAADDDPRLPEGVVDLVLMVDVYHELSEPETIMKKVRRALSPDGRVALVEYRGEDPRVPIKPLHRMTLAQVRAEMEALSLRITRVHEFLPRQRIIVCVADEVPRREGIREPEDERR